MNPTRRPGVFDRDVASFGVDGGHDVIIVHDRDEPGTATLDVDEDLVSIFGVDTSEIVAEVEFRGYGYC